MGMVDLTRSAEADAPQAPEGMDRPVCVYLGTDEIKKLGLTDAQVGDEFMLELQVKVTSLSSSETKSDKSSNMTLAASAGQAEAKDEPASEEEKASALYSKG